MSASVVIPFKSLNEGKSRLAACLTPELRRRLCRAMLRDTLALVAGMRDVIVVSDDDQVRPLADAAGARFLPAERRDLNLALNQARGLIVPGRSMLVLPIDLVLLERAQLEWFLAAPDQLGIAPDRAWDGTNLLHLPPAAVPAFRFEYGAGSLARHTAQARRMGFEPRLVYMAGTAFDLDTPADLDTVNELRCGEFSDPIFA